MRYMGSKNRIAKYILPFLQEHLNGSNYFVDAFCGGCNLIDKLDYPNRIANDSNRYLIALFEHLQGCSDVGEYLPEYTTREEYYSVKVNKDAYPDWYVGYVGFLCSRLGKFFDCWVGKHIDGRNYQDEMSRNLFKQLRSIEDVTFVSVDYSMLCLPSNSVIYCDPPYKGARGYGNKFDHDRFWQWCRDMTAKGHKVFVSEYNAPEDFKCVWQMEVTTSIAVSKTTKSIEKLFTYEQ